MKNTYENGFIGPSAVRPSQQKRVVEGDSEACWTKVNETRRAIRCGGLVLPAPVQPEIVNSRNTLFSNQKKVSFSGGPS